MTHSVCYLKHTWFYISDTYLFKVFKKYLFRHTQTDENNKPLQTVLFDNLVFALVMLFVCTTYFTISQLVYNKFL